LQTFWSWEHKLLKQEQQYFENHLTDIKGEIEAELEVYLSKDQSMKEGAETPNMTLYNQVRKEIEAKYE